MSEEIKEQVEEFVEGPRQFFKDGMQFLNRCAKPDQKEYMQICRAVGMGFFALGFLGYIIKLIHIPINNILVGAA